MDSPRPGTFDPLDIPISQANIYQLTGRHPHVKIEYTANQLVTIISGLPLTIDLSKVLKTFKKRFCCNGNIDYNENCGEILRLYGDYKQAVIDFLVNEKIIGAEPL